MEASPLDRHAVNPAATHDQLVRLSEPWSVTRSIAIVATLIFAMVLAHLATTGQYAALVLVAVWVIATATIVFVRDHWWSPAILITALSLKTYALGFALTGLEIGMVILALTFPIKKAMKTLWPVSPKLPAGAIFWTLLGYFCLHAVIILIYSKIDNAPQPKNIIKAYYGAIAPLILYAMMLRFCKPRTVVQTGAILLGIYIVTSIIALIVAATGFELPYVQDLKLQVDFLNGEVSLIFLRGTGPAMFVWAIAFWPVARVDAYKVILAIAIALGAVGTLFGGGRATLGVCFLAAAFFAVARRKYWLAIPVVLILLIASAAVTTVPGFVDSLPTNIQRTLALLNFSENKNEIQSSLQGSDEWHQQLRSESIPYWMQDTVSFWVGHGFKSWDDSIVLMSAEGGGNADLETVKQFAIEMGITENMFSAITNIFGLVGLLLYAAFLIQLTFRTWKARGICPPGSAERAFCEFSFVQVVTMVLMAPFAGGVPNISLLFCTFGVLAARNYIGIPDKETVIPHSILSFDKSHDATVLTGGEKNTGGRGLDPMESFIRRRHRPGTALP
jgi:hypothetical protein